MKLKFVMIFCTLLLASPIYAEEKQELKTQKEKRSYSIGYGMGASLKRDEMDIDPGILARALKDAYTGNKPLMSEQEMGQIIMALQQEIQKKQKEQQAKQQEVAKVAAEKNKKDGEAFLAANKKKEGVVTMPSGLQYRILTAGKGKSPKATDTVTVNYKGMTIDGKEFDSSYKRGQPATFPLNQVIPGWTEAVQLMKEGAKYELFIPANLAYGERGAGANIAGNSTLIFEVELISIK